MTSEIGNSNLLRTWANDGTVVVPSNLKIDEGWLRGEQPPHEWMNYIHNVLGQKVNHALSRGAADWNSSTEYLAGAIVNRNGDLWLALATNTDSAPADANADWYRITAHDADLIVHGLTVGRGAGNQIANAALGFGALQDNTTGDNNVAIGQTSLNENTTGTNNTSVGRQAMLRNTTGGSNIAIGHQALFNNTIAGSNVAVGRTALFDNTIGEDNTALGRATLSNNTTGNRNTGLGRNALSTSTTGNNNIAIGFEAARSGSPFTITNQSNRIVMGNNDHTDAYIRIAWTVTSDARDKAEFAPVPYGLDFVNALQPTQYQMKSGGRDGEGDGRNRLGFLAQDVLALEGESPVIVDNENPDSLKLHETYLIPVLVNAIKELTARIEELEAK
jgi:hypothetical protein